MPNLKHLVSLKKRFSTFNQNLSEKDTELIIEAFDRSRIEKSFSFNDEKVDRYVTFFNNRKKVKAVLLFIDITSFSIKFEEKSPDEIAEYLDKYYSLVLPIVGKYGGEIEKIIGDGIIAVFGPPFLEGTSHELHVKAENCAKDIVELLSKSIFQSKIALYFGEIMYYQNTSNEYYEYTMIGNALTNLFRLESVSLNNSINFFSNTNFYLMKLVEKEFSVFTYGEKLKWNLSDLKEVNLQGVSHKYFTQLTMQ
jgi:hypothetical protein